MVAIVTNRIRRLQHRLSVLFLRKLITIWYHKMAELIALRIRNKMAAVNCSEVYAIFVYILASVVS
jgi:hypothetical protein